MPNGLVHFIVSDTFISYLRGIFPSNSRVFRKQCRSWSDTAFCEVWFRSTVFFQRLLYGTPVINGLTDPEWILMKDCFVALFACFSFFLFYLKYTKKVINVPKILILSYLIGLLLENAMMVCLKKKKQKKELSYNNSHIKITETVVI